MPHLKAEVEELKHTVAMLPSIHQAEVKELCTAHQVEVEQLRDLHSTKLDQKDSFCEAEKVCVLMELQASYKTKLLGLYDEQYKQDY